MQKGRQAIPAGVRRGKGANRELSDSSYDWPNPVVTPYRERSGWELNIIGGKRMNVAVLLPPKFHGRHCGIEPGSGDAFL